MELKGSAEWADVQPIPQDDGPNPACPIAYDEEFREAMDYFRAVVAKEEISERALLLTSHVIAQNPANYSVWHYRRKLLRALQADLHKELLYIGEIIEANLKNYQVWQWAMVRFQLFATLPGNGLQYVDELLETDVWNNSAWSHRHFVCRSTNRYSDTAGWAAERDYCLARIKQSPNNESSWNYLHGLVAAVSQSYADDAAIAEAIEALSAEDPPLRFALRARVDLMCSRALACADGVAAQDALQTCLRLKDEVDGIRAKYWAWRHEQLAKQLATVLASS
ncbi:uncharacterized protein MONBRDRAFT_29023 [Monosiga brevicollis MX1]|uniref:Protein farnesyltransferase/geranylgeranyltransferase type-1 subunit alpha n=1 Tax=Monosiga brevicollis TaxID=81824 RepID=A9V9V9_MONBE|nr:uncharacterized protein MONBRDRAFT_29023 [Monosiga brevicollis MX1]EDQ85556.1 predicted protein [Monosiga brevicollis MX1]|eukprot:XP_001749505.1 hypothetical protein [Monosiga brevicollis MX1]